ncbi:MAG: HNH endonuclease [Microbacteriaceae bacterium]|nr:HNH endonuclease [Microbacteriaceae bacterium]
MGSTLEGLRELAAAVAAALPHALVLTSLSAQEEAEALRVLGGIRTAICEPISVLASDIQRKSERTLGTEGLAQRNGFADGVGYVQDLLQSGRDEAFRLVREGGLREAAERAAPSSRAVPPERSIEVLRGLPGAWDAPIAVALRYGWLSAAQADALRRNLGAPRTDDLAGAWREGCLGLIADCWGAQWGPEDLARAAKRLRSCLDDTAAAAEARGRYEQRSLRRFVRESGMVHYDLELDPESDARLYGPIKRLLSPRFGGPRFTAADDIAAAEELEADPGSNEQLQVDTLLDLLDRAVSTDDGTLFATERPQVTVAVTAAELRKARENAETGIAWIDGNDQPITAADALRMICTTGFTPALFDETGQAIDIGKDQRYFTARQRKALVKRDGGCLYPGCDRPPHDCEAHHINPWAEYPGHRRTETRDGVLLCRRHHKMLHDHGAAVRRDGSEYRLHWPGKSPVRLHTKAGIQTQLRAERQAA